MTAFYDRSYYNRSFQNRYRPLFFAGILFMLLSAPSPGFAQSCEDQAMKLAAANLALHVHLSPVFEAAELSIAASSVSQNKPALDSIDDYFLSFIFSEDTEIQLRPHDLSKDLRWAVSHFVDFEDCLTEQDIDNPLAHRWRALVDLKNTTISSLPSEEDNGNLTPANAHAIMTSFTAYDQAILENVSSLEGFLNATSRQLTSKDKFASKPRIDAQRVLSMDQNHPNPFNPTTQIRFTLPEATQVRLSVYDMVGREIENLAFGVYAAGSHEVTFEAGNLPSGTYLYRLDTPKDSFTQKMLILK